MRSITHVRFAARRAAGASALALAAALAVSASPAAAQPAAAPADSNTIGEVVVTAQFREQSLQNTPIAITAVNAAMLEQRSQTSIEQVANQAPNVTLKPQGSAFGPSLGASIRGVGQYDFNPALEPGVGMYVDDVYYSTLTGSILDLLDLDRVEILRGPQGTLAGKNSIGGAVKLYSKKPTGSGDGYFQATYGGLNRLEARGSADFAIVPDVLFMRLSGVTKHYDGYVTRLDYTCANPGSALPSFTSRTDCKLGSEGGKDYSAVRAAARWLPTENLEVNIIGDFTSDTSQNPATTLLYANNANPFVAVNGVPYDSRFIPSDPYVSYANYFMPGKTAIPFSADPFFTDGGSRYSGWGVSGQIDWKLADNLSLRSVTAQRAYTSDWSEDNDVSPLALGLGSEHLSHRQFSQELRLNANVGEVLDLTVGGFYFRQNTIYATHQDLWYPGIVLDFLGNDPVLAHTKALFAHSVWHVTDRVNLTGGVRYTKEDKSYTFSRRTRTGALHPVLGAADGVTGHYEGDRWDYRVSADFKVTDTVLTYATISTGFKGGGINPRPFVVQQIRSFGPETLTAYELGFKSSLFERRMRLNGAVFYNKYKDIQLTSLSCPQFGGPGPCALPQNAGDATVKGAELEAEIHPAGGLTIDGSISYLDFKYDRIDPQAGVPGGAGVQKSMVPPYSPKWKWSVGAQYEFDVGDAGSLTPRFDIAYQSRIFTNAVNAPINGIEGYTVANARLTWRAPDRDWEASLEVTNLTDKLYYTTKFDLTGAGAGSVAGQPGMPREWAVTVKKSF